ncbi:MAG: class I SAM-dependent methyltransferase [Acidobacteriaceae bacterium]|nr:class I SAM-dependent methyltransferase [Acidobacteriaceae bacterium]MBV8571719.1 class I SAM-dependent methyltransferase [Acidobacteriaceae bacterium]
MSIRIEHVSDTALLVAASRALESERADGLIRDPFAARLAGDRGMALLKSVPIPQWVELGIGLRTRLLDELLAIALQNGADSVFSLGAGLDARPWRLKLAGDLQWTEVDFPEILDYKYSLLEGAAPHCYLERRSADLNNESERRRVIADAISGGRHPVLISEGLLMYLPAETVRALAVEARQAGFPYWLLDTSSPGLLRRAHGDALEQINRVRAESHVEGPQIRQVIELQGWKPFERRLFVEEAPKLAHERILKIIEAEGRPAEPPENDGSGVWLYCPDFEAE